MIDLKKEMIRNLDAYLNVEETLNVISSLEEQFNLDELQKISEAACQDGACKELAFWVVPFLYNLSKRVSDDNKIQLYIEAGMVYAYSYEIEEFISEELKLCMKKARYNFQDDMIEYVLKNRFDIIDEYYLIGSLITFYNHRLGASLLYGNLFAYENDVELDLECVYHHKLCVNIKDDGVWCNDKLQINKEKIEEMVLFIKKWKKNDDVNDLLELVNAILQKINLPQMRNADKMECKDTKEMFVIVGTILSYLGYNDEAGKYFYMLNDLECPICNNKFMIAEQWEL